MGAAASADAAPVRFGEVLVVGGGCYGTFYAQQLARAVARGRAVIGMVTVIDRDPGCRARTELGPAPGRRFVVSDWTEFFDARLRAAPSGPDEDAIVPSPLMPHLMYEWVLRRARERWPARAVTSAPVDQPLGTPYDTQAPDGTRYVSYADWICPVHCIEPLTCPVIRGPRTWEMAEALRALTARLDETRPTAGPAVLHCRHRVYGVGMFGVAEVQAADRLVVDAVAAHGGTAVDVVVGTVSSCHGAVSLVRVGPERL